MRQTLFFIPETAFGLPMFGWGLLLAIWAAAAVISTCWLVYRHGWTSETAGYLPLWLVMGAAIFWLLPGLSEPDHGVPIRGYGVMLLIAVTSSVALAMYRGRRRGLDPEMILSLGFWLFAAGILGARAFYVIEYWRDQFYHARPDGSFDLAATLKAVVNVSQGGLVVYGALIAAGIAALVFFRKHHLPALAWGDAIAPSLVLGLAIGRIGCLLNGCCFGGECSLRWAVTFPIGSPPYQRQVEQNKIGAHGLYFDVSNREAAIIQKVESGSQAEAAGLKAGEQIIAIHATEPGKKETSPPITDAASALGALLRASGEGTRLAIETADRPGPAEWIISPVPQSLPVHPTQIYSSIDAFLLCLFLLAYDPFRRREGELVVLLLALNAISRFLLESIRTDEPKVYFGMSVSQVISLGLVLLAAMLWAYVRRQPKRVVQTEPVAA